MADDAQGQKAIDELNQAEYDGKVINVTVAVLEQNVLQEIVAVSTVTTTSTVNAKKEDTKVVEAVSF